MPTVLRWQHNMKDLSVSVTLFILILWDESFSSHQLTPLNWLATKYAVRQCIGNHETYEIKALCFNLKLRTKFFTLKCLCLSRASWRNGSIPHIWVSQNGTETTNLPVNVSVRVTLSRLEQRRADFQPLGVRDLFETALRMNSSTGSFIQTFMLRKWHARRVVVRGGMDGWVDGAWTGGGG